MQSQNSDEVYRIWAPLQLPTRLFHHQWMVPFSMMMNSFQPLTSSHSGLLTLPQTHQPCSGLWAFPLTVLSAWNTIPHISQTWIPDFVTSLPQCHLRTPLYKTALPSSHHLTPRLFQMPLFLIREYCIPATNTIFVCLLPIPRPGPPSTPHPHSNVGTWLCQHLKWYLEDIVLNQYLFNKQHEWMRYWHQALAECRMGAVLNHSPPLSHLILPNCFTIEKIKRFIQRGVSGLGESNLVLLSPTPRIFPPPHRTGRVWKETNEGKCVSVSSGLP